MADAILDRLVRNAYKIALKGESMRKRQAKLTTKAKEDGETVHNAFFDRTFREGS